MKTNKLAQVALIIATIMLLALTSAPLMAQIEWPQEIKAEEGSIVVYQPQPESLEGNILRGRAAIALEIKGQDEPIFGAMWFSARIETNQDTDIVTVLDFNVEAVAWPDSKDAGEQRFTAIVEGAVPETGFKISMERLSASLETADVEKKSLEQLKTDPPIIIFSQELSVLLLYDGDPRFSPVENSNYERAMNTPFAVARDKTTQQSYLTSGDFWYSAIDPLGPWTVTNRPPQDLVQNMPKPESDESGSSEPPLIVVATEPTELITTQGKPNWSSLSGGELLYVENTETPWLRDLSTNNMYVLLSGRWFRSQSKSGPWTFVRSDELPASFKNIPPASDIGGLRTSVAGTEEAEAAIQAAAIPQTAAIKRSEASLTVEYDGTPKFEKISGTDVSYAVNTGAQVLEVNSKYYAVDNGVWFVSAAATGPWVVADDIPDEQIQQIPPSAPVYNTTYVQVYQSTPEVVYVGYRPGYLWSFPYYGVPVYGTGWYYPPYWGRYYYPRPPTWGLHVGYNPWTGWNFGVSWSNGFFRVGIGWGGGWGGGYRPGRCCGGWYGGGYRRPVVINTGNINIGNNVNIGNRNNFDNKLSRDSNRQRTDSLQNKNLYNRADNRTRNADRATVNRDLKQARPANRANNVYADKSGNVARRDGDKWQTRQGGSWKDAPASGAANRPSTQPANRPSTKPSTRPAYQPSTQPSTRPATRPVSSSSINQRDLNRTHQSRQTGRSREMSRSSMNRGGGRRR
jgi:hypothetical protein